MESRELGLLKYIKKYLNSKVVAVVASKCPLRLSSGVCGPKTTLKVSVQNDFWCILLPLSQWWDKVVRSMQWSDWRLSSNNVFFLPSFFPLSPPINNMLAIAKKKKKQRSLVIFLLIQIRSSFFSFAMYWS